MAGGGSAPAPGSGGGKRDVDFQLNMIPFIDLLSVMISFLLFTAIWTNIAKIDVKSSPTQPANEPSATPPEDAVKLSVLIKKSGYEVGGGVEKATSIEGYNLAELEAALATLRARYPENKAITLISEDAIPYRELIAVMDVCLKSSLNDIAIDGVDG